MRELTFFLGLHVQQSEEGIFISQDKYVDEILKNFDFASIKTASTPIETQKPLGKDEVAADVDVHLYRSIIRSLMYLTASRPDIMFAICACSRFQVTLKLSHLQAVKRIFRYLKGQPKLGLWYPRYSPFDLEAYSDSDYARVNLNRKSTIGVNSVKQIHAILMERLWRQETTLGGVDAQIRFEIAYKRSSDPPLSTCHTVGSREERMEQETDLTDFVPLTPHDSPFSGGRTPTAQDLVIQRLLKKVKRLEKKQRARTPGMKLFKIGTSKKKTLDKEYVSKQGMDESKEAKKLNLFDKGSGETKVFDYITAAKKDVNDVEPVFTSGDAVNAASVVPDVSVVGPFTSTAGDIFKDEMITMADTLMAIRRKRPRTTSVVIHNIEEEPRRATPPPTVQSQDKGKGKMVEPEPISKNAIKAQIQRDAKITQRLFEEEQAQFEREQRIAREKLQNKKPRMLH
nr:hypothetical protein [Tanacetum cinerariifolium]